MTAELVLKTGGCEARGKRNAWGSCSRETGSKDKNLLQIGRGRRLLADRDEAAGCGGFGETAGLSQGDAEDRTRREALEVQ